VANGLALRPIAVTSHDTLEWFKKQDQERRDKLQLHIERDSDIIKAWQNRT